MTWLGYQLVRGPGPECYPQRPHRLCKLWEVDGWLLVTLLLALALLLHTHGGVQSLSSWLSGRPS